jgi:hypothetical protein
VPKPTLKARRQIFRRQISGRAGGKARRLPPTLESAADGLQRGGRIRQTEPGCQQMHGQTLYRDPAGDQIDQAADGRDRCLWCGDSDRRLPVRDSGTTANVFNGGMTLKWTTKPS